MNIFDKLAHKMNRKREIFFVFFSFEISIKFMEVEINFNERRNIFRTDQMSRLHINQIDRSTWKREKNAH